MEHTADVGVEAEAETFESLLGELALGMFEFIVDPQRVRASVVYDVGEIQAPSAEAAVVKWLNELLYLHEANEVVFSRFSVERAGDVMIGKAWGEGIDAERHAPIGVVKAATYHRLSVERKDGAWRARVYFDV